MHPRRIPAFVAALALPLLAACGGDDDPTGPEGLTEVQIYQQCVVSTLGNASTTPVTVSGTINAQDCSPQGSEGGRIEGYLLPQSSFGDLASLQIDLDANFDGAIVVITPDGAILLFGDDDIGGDLGAESVVLPADMDASSPTYYVGVFAWPGETGTYSLTVGPPATTAP